MYTYKIKREKFGRSGVCSHQSELQVCFGRNRSPDPAADCRVARQLARGDDARLAPSRKGAFGTPGLLARPALNQWPQQRPASQKRKRSFTRRHARVGEESVLLLFFVSAAGGGMEEENSCRRKRIDRWQGGPAKVARFMSRWLLRPLPPAAAAEGERQRRSCAAWCGATHAFALADESRGHAGPRQPQRAGQGRREKIARREKGCVCNGWCWVY